VTFAAPAGRGNLGSMDFDWIEKREEKGLRFGCTQCGHCCCQFPGYVWVTPEEIAKIAAMRGLSVDEFGRRYLRKIGSRYSLVEDSRNRCVMLGEDNRCTVYAERPSQCRTFPFWTSAIRTEKTWNALKEFCPGVDHGPLHGIAEIRATVQKV